MKAIKGILGLGVGVLIVFGIGSAVLAGGKAAVHHVEQGYAKDVALTPGQCGQGPFGDDSAGITVTNHSSGLSDYIVTVEFYDPSGVNVAKGYAFVNQVPSHDTRISTADSTSTAGGPLTCKITDVTRTAS